MVGQTLMFARKTVRDCSNPKIVLAFLIPYLGIGTLLALGFASGAPDDLGSAPISTQEQVLLELFSQYSFVWLLAFPMLLVGLLAGQTIALEAQKGTFRLLLSKPINRWEPLLGKFLGIVFYGLLAMVAGLFFGAALLVHFSGASSAAIAGSILPLSVGGLVYGLVITVFIAAIGTSLAVLTGSRLKTALGTAIVPILFFAFIFVRLLPFDDIYDDFRLWAVDVNYHFGNLYVFIQELVGQEFNPAMAEAFALPSGVFDVTTAWMDPMMGGIVGSVPLVEHVPPVGSFSVVLLLSVGLIAAAIYRFERMDVP